MKKTIWFVTCLLLYTNSYADWVDNWFDNAIIHENGHFENQQRGFYSAGGFSGRVNVNQDYLVSASLPRLSSGCGGVDLFLGGVSFLDSDYMVKKLQSILQAAPAVAFDIALKTMAKELSDSISKFEAATNWLNSLQLNDCAISKRVVAEVQKDDPQILSAVWNEITSGVSLKEATSKHYHSTQEKIKAADGKSPIDLKKQIQGCPKLFKSIFSKGSVVENTTKTLGMADYSDLIRGIVGDVEIKADKNEPIPVVSEVSACPANDSISLEDFLYGNVERRSSLRQGGKCRNNRTKSITSIVDKKLHAIVNRIKNNQAMTKSQIKFINQSPVPVFKILRKAVLMDNVDMTIEYLRDFVAIMMASKIFDDLYRHIDTLFSKVQESISQPGSQTDKSSCNVAVYAHAIGKFEKLRLKVWQSRLEARDYYQQKLEEQISFLKFAKLHEQEERALRKNNAMELITP